jgi:hypothetical protein
MQRAIGDRQQRSGGDPARGTHRGGEDGNRPQSLEQSEQFRKHRVLLDF